MHRHQGKLPPQREETPHWRNNTFSSRRKNHLDVELISLAREAISSRCRTKNVLAWS